MANYLDHLEDWQPEALAALDAHVREVMGPE